MKNKKNSFLPIVPTTQPVKVETYAGKHTARVTKIFKQPDGSTVKATRKINKDGSISDKIEHKHMWKVDSEHLNLCQIFNFLIFFIYSIVFWVARVQWYLVKVNSNEINLAEFSYVLNNQWG